MEVLQLQLEALWLGAKTQDKQFNTSKKSGEQDGQHKYVEMFFYDVDVKNELLFMIWTIFYFAADLDQPYSFGFARVDIGSCVMYLYSCCITHL